jgi:hypothetical protein
VTDAEARRSGTLPTAPTPAHRGASSAPPSRRACWASRSSASAAPASSPGPWEWQVSWPVGWGC